MKMTRERLEKENLPAFFLAVHKHGAQTCAPEAALEPVLSPQQSSGLPRSRISGLPAFPSATCVKWEPAGTED